MKKLQEQVTKERQIHLDKMAAARGGKKRKLEGKMFHNPKFEGTYVRDFSKIGRNALCPCGSKLKSKRCCLA